MKDVISILQSRIARRKKEFFKLTMPVYIYEDSFEYSVYSKVRDGLKPNHPDVVVLAEEQKQDKRILAEIVRLRREANGNFLALLQRVATPDEYARKKLEAKWMGE